jgi:hypothetical protein
MDLLPKSLHITIDNGSQQSLKLNPRESLHEIHSKPAYTMTTCPSGQLMESDLAFDVGHEREFYKYGNARTHINLDRAADLCCLDTINPSDSAWQRCMHSRTSRRRDRRVHRPTEH